LTILVSALMISRPVTAQNPAPAESIDMYVFVLQGCPHCAVVESKLDEWKETSHPKINARILDLAKSGNANIFNDFRLTYSSQSTAVPTLFIGDKVIVGEKVEEIEKAISNCEQNYCPDPNQLVQDYLKRHEPASSDAAANDIQKNQMIALIVAGILVIGVVILFIVLQNRKKIK